MRISATIFVILISTCIVNASVLDPVIENVVHLKASHPPTGVAGIWKKKTIWKPRWVKEWKSAKVMKPVWKKVWSPVQIREWVPIPKPPPGWDSNSTPLSSVHPKPQQPPFKDSTGHDSFAVHTSTKIPLWDPVPYPESQQPPPPPPQPSFPQPLHHSCASGDCDNSHSATFNQEQISEIIGPRYNAAEYYQNAETVNHLTRLPPEGNNWRAPVADQQKIDNRFNGFPGLPEFLVPPTSPPSQNNIRLEHNHRFQAGPSSETHNLRQWTPLPQEMKIKGHFITKAPDHPYKFQLPVGDLNIKNRTEISQSTDLKEKPNPQSFRPAADGDFIQEAHLVGEYHYSEFDLHNVQQDVKKPIPEERPKQQEKVKDVQKTRINQPPPRENQFRQNRTETKQDHHPQKKHIINNTDLNFQQQKAILKDIFPIYNKLIGKNDNSVQQKSPGNSNNHKQQAAAIFTSNSTIVGGTKQQQKENYPIYEIPPFRYLQTTAPNSSLTQQRKENYPIYEIPEIQAIIQSKHRFSEPKTSHASLQQQSPVQQPALPPNHKYSPPSGVESPERPSSSHLTTKLLPIALGKVAISEKGLFDRNNSVQLVFPSASDGLQYQDRPAEDSQKTTTTEPYSVIFSSSLLATSTETATSPVIIVTPASQSKS